MKHIICLTLVCSLAFIGCASDNPNKKTGYGAMIGAATGAAAGMLLNKKDKKKGALLGGLLGGMLGGGVGKYLDKQAAELREIAETKRTEHGIVTKLKGDITFSSGKAQVTSVASDQINKIASIIKKYPEDILTVTGHTDSTGSMKINQSLSESRAAAVKNLLVNGGVPSGSISTIGVGPSQPLASNDNSTGRSANRRVEISITIDESKIQKK